MTKEYVVKLTVEVVVTAGNEFAAEAEAKDLVEILPNTSVVRTNSVKPNKYMVGA
jgi:hypothetical protein